MTNLITGIILTISIVVAIAYENVEEIAVLAGFTIFCVTLYLLITGIQCVIGKKYSTGVKKDA